MKNGMDEGYVSNMFHPLKHGFLNILRINDFLGLF